MCLTRPALAGAPVKPGSVDAPEGAAFYFSFRVPGAKNPLYLEASTGLTGTTYAMGDIEPSANGSTYTAASGVVTGSVVGGVVTISVSRSVLGALGDVRPGVRLTGLTADVFYSLEVPEVGGLLETADTATGKLPYVAGSASCVKP